MEIQNSLIHAFILDGQGGGRPMDWDEIRSWTPEQGFLWVHLQLAYQESRDWLQKESGLDAILTEALLDSDGDPRFVKEGEGLLAMMRGVNLNRGADPEDMAFLNLWIDQNRAISLRREKLMSVQDIRREIEANKGPKDGGGLLVRLLDRLLDRMEPVMDDLEKELDEIEVQSAQAVSEDLSVKLLALRHEVIGLRRYLIPQRRALAALYREPVPWLKKVHKRWIREKDDQIQRFLADLESYRDRAIAVRDEISSRLSERMNRAMYMLSVVTGVFLPLGFLTGLLGINVGGMPGVEYKWAFWVVCGLLAGVTGFSLWTFRRLKWI
ncbi:MAG: zinc transporter ZntB [Magnetococcales bacterium]|nr:zinc transporter ZntB [Magnetococcales bacterium]